MKVTQLCLTLRPHGLYSPWNSPGWNTGVGSLSLLQGPFPTQGLKPGVPHCRRILYQLSHQGSPRILEWVAYPFSGYSQPRNRTRVSCTAGTFFTNWAIREAQLGCVWLCNPIDCSLSGSSVHGISQVKILEWVAIPFCRGPSQHRDQTLASCLGRQFLYHWATLEAHTLFHFPVLNDPSHSWLQTPWNFKYCRKNKNSLDSHTTLLPSLRKISGFSLFCRLRDFLVWKFYKSRHIKNT